jgi:ASCH domain
VKALSIKQPWAWLIASGHKDIENRTWLTSYRGPFLIHAGKRYDGDRRDWDWPDIQRPEGFDMGGIVGVAELVDCVTNRRSRWFRGPYGFVIRDARPLPFRACRGALRFFNP